MEEINQFFRHLFGTEGFFPRDSCRVNWPPYLVQLHNVCDLAIWAAYLAIPIVLFFFVARKKERLPFRHLFWLFGIFILSCGMTHFMEFYTFQIPMYRLAGLIKLVTAISSWGTVAALIPITPIALAMRTPKELESVIQERTSELESERTALASANQALQSQIEERHRVESLLREEQLRVLELNTSLEQRVKERTAELEASNRELESFAHAVAHDLRAPLRAIDGFSHALLDDLGPDIATGPAENVNRVRRATKRMDALITALLTLSRLTRQAVHRQEVDLSALAAELFDEIKATDPSRHVEVVIQPGLHAIGDPNLLRVLLTNLIANAWKFTAPREDARIEFGRSSEGDFYVKDNGVGFNMGYVGRLFRPFERLHSADSFPGSGIGLATCQRIIAKHGGEIRAEAEIDKGATFYFSL